MVDDRAFPGPASLSLCSQTVCGDIVIASEPVPRLALTPTEAAAAIGVSRDYFDDHVLPEVRVVQRGRRKLVPVRELERWLERSAALALDR
jgi:hypothetical protein